MHDCCSIKSGQFFVHSAILAILMFEENRGLRCMKIGNIVSVIIAGNIMNVLSAIVAEIMQILQNQIKQNVRTDSANESIHC